MMRVLASSLAICLAVGCGGEGGYYASSPLAYGPANPVHEEGPNDGLPGDWFGCQDATCAGLMGDGFRITEDGLAYMLEAEDSPLTPDGTYCVDYSPERVVLTFVANGWQLLLPDSGVADVAPTGQPDVMLFVAEEVTWFMKRVWPTRVSTRCDEEVRFDQPLPVPRRGTPPGR